MNNTLKSIEPLILTFNEEVNLRRTLNCLNSFKRIVIIDSYSTDQTIEIAKEFSNVVFYQKEFENHTDQWNYGLTKISSTWVLSLDADYIISEKLLDEIAALDLNTTNITGYNISFKYCINGSPLKGTILPPRIALFNKLRSTYFQDGHTQMLKSEGPLGRLANSIFHDDRKSLDKWLLAQSRYVDLERIKLLSTPLAELSFADKIRSKKYFAPFIIFIYCLFIKKGIFDGRRGLFYAFQRMYFETLLSLKLMKGK